MRAFLPECVAVGQRAATPAPTIPIMPSRRLVLAFAASLLLHAALPVGDFLSPDGDEKAAPPPLQALLLPAPPLPAADEALIKNTLADDSPDPLPAPPVPSAAQKPAAAAPPPKPPRPRSLRAVERKLTEQVFYPPEAVARGLEGRVMILFVFADGGRVVEVQLAAGSGHALLDQAALRAAGAIGRVPGAAAGEMILPVIFQLE